MSIQFHPAAEIFPGMGEDEFRELVDDIRANGLREPIVCTPEGEVLDGRHRHRACREAGIEAAFTTTDAEPWRYVISRNLYRRHLTDAQRAMVAAKVAERPKGRPRKEEYAPGGSISPPTREQARDMFKVSDHAVKRARQVHSGGTESLKSAVDGGTVTLSAAADLAQQPAAEQDQVVSQIESEPVAAAPNSSAPPQSEQPRKRPRAPLNKSAVNAGWNIRQAVDRCQRVLNDDRYPQNKDQVTRAMRGHLAYTVEIATSLLDTLPEIDQKTGEVSE